MNNPLLIRRLGRQSYMPVLEAMRGFTERRDGDTADEFWLLEHEPVFTLDQSGKQRICRTNSYNTISFYPHILCKTVTKAYP